MQTIYVRNKSEKFIHSILYSSLGGLLLILPAIFFDLNIHNLLWILISLFVILIFLYNFRRNSDDVLGDLLYVKYNNKHNTYHISHRLKKMIEEDHSIPGQLVHFGQNKSKQLGTILKEIAANTNAEEYNGSIISIDRLHFKLDFLLGEGSYILCIFYDMTSEIKSNKDLQKSNDEAKILAILHGSLLSHIPIPIVARNTSMDIIYYNQPYYDLAIGPEGVFDKDKLQISAAYTKSALEALGSNDIVITERSVIIDNEKESYEVSDIPDKESAIVISYHKSIKEEGRLKNILRDLRLGMTSFLDSLDYACMVIDKGGFLKYHNSKLAAVWNLDSGMLGRETTHTEILDHLYLSGKLPAQSDYTKFKTDRLAMHGRLRIAKEDFFYLSDGSCIRAAAVPFEEDSILFTYEDITQRLNVERSLRFADKIRDAIISNAAKGICIFDKNGDLLVINDRMIKIWNLPEDTEQSNFTSDRFIEKSFAGLKETEAAKIQEAFTKALVSNIRVEQVLKIGDNNMIQRVIMQLPDKSIMITDNVVTEDFMKMESYLSEIKTLKSIDKDKTTFLANMPHKIRGAVNSLIGISHILLTQKVANLSKEQGEYLKDIKRSVEYISKILDETVDLSEFKNLYDIPILRDIDLSKPIENALDSLKDDFRTKQISVDFKSKVKDKTCFLDGSRLQNIIISILQNAIYRSRPGGIIDVELGLDDNKFILLISDNGIPYELSKDSNNANSYNSLSITYAKMLLDSMNLELIARYDNEAKLSRFKIILVNDRTFHEFEE